MIRVRFSEAAREAPKFTAVVVLPTPPFWLVMATIRAKKKSPSGNANLTEHFLSMQYVSRGTIQMSAGIRMFHVERFPRDGYFGRSGEPTRRNRFCDAGIWIGSRQDHCKLPEIRAASSPPTQRTSFPDSASEPVDHDRRFSNAPTARAVTKSNLAGSIRTSSIRDRVTVTLERARDRMTSDRNVDFFKFDSISSTKSSGESIARGIPGKPAPEPTSASRPK